MPVPAVVLVPHLPGDDMRESDPDLLVAAGTAVDLGRPTRRHGAHDPVAVRTALRHRGEVIAQRTDVVLSALGSAWHTSSVAQARNIELQEIA
jgi:hypothetical protein